MLYHRYIVTTVVNSLTNNKYCIFYHIVRWSAYAICLESMQSKPIVLYKNITRQTDRQTDFVHKRDRQSVRPSFSGDVGKMMIRHAFLLNLTNAKLILSFTAACCKFTAEDLAHNNIGNSLNSINSIEYFCFMKDIKNKNKVSSLF